MSHTIFISSSHQASLQSFLQWRILIHECIQQLHDCHLLVIQKYMEEILGVAISTLHQPEILSHKIKIALHQN